MFKEFPDDDSRVDDFLNEFRQKISDQNIENIEEKKEEMKRSKSVFLGVVGGVILAGIVGKLILAPQYQADSEKDIPVIRRPQTAIRVQPNEPGGMDIPNQDKSVYNIIEKKDDSGVENLLPPPEAPKLPVIAAQDLPEVNDKILDESSTLPEAEKIIQKAEAKTAVTTAEIIKKAEETAPEPVKEEKVAQAQPAVVKEEKPAQPAAAEVKAPVESAKVEVKTAEAKPAEPKPEKADPEKKAPAAQAVSHAKAVAGDWQIQLMSSPNKAAVVKAQSDLGKKYKIADLPFEIESAVLDMNKTFYRLKTGAFKNRADADKVCNDIKALGGTCIVKKK